MNGADGLDFSRLLLTGRLALQVSAELRWGENEVRAAEHPSPADVAWATSISGFHPPHHSDTAHITWVHAMGAGVDSWIETVRTTKAALTRTVGRMPERAARYVATAVLHEEQGWNKHVVNQSLRRWEPTPGITERPVLVVGTGTIGRAVAKGLIALGYDVQGASRTGRRTDPFDIVLTGRDLPLALPRFGHVVMALPHTPDTNRLVDSKFLGALRSATLINVGRSSAIDYKALQDALSTGVVVRAILDVHPVEPLPDAAWQWSDPRVLVTPHVAAPTSASDVVTALLETKREADAGRPLPLLIDPTQEY